MSSAKFLFLSFLLLVSVHADDDSDSDDSDDSASWPTSLPQTTFEPTTETTETTVTTEEDSTTPSPTVRTRRPTKTPVTPSPITLLPTPETTTPAPTTFLPTPERLPVAGESCRDDECAAGLSCNDGFICVPCGQFDEPCCDTRNTGNPSQCADTLICEFIDAGLTVQRCRLRADSNQNAQMQAGDDMTDTWQQGATQNNRSLRSATYIIATLIVSISCMLVGACLMIGCWKCHNRRSQHTAVADYDQDAGEESVVMDERDTEMILSAEGDRI